MTNRSEAPLEKITRADQMKVDATALEKEAIREAIALGDGYLKRAAAILGKEPSMLSRAVCKPSGRHHDLSKLLRHQAGKPPVEPKAGPKALSELQGKLHDKPNGARAKPQPKPQPKAKPKGIQPFSKKTEAEWQAIVKQWLEARKTGANQKAFAMEHGVGVSTLRERTAAFLASSDVPMEDAAEAVTG